MSATELSLQFKRIAVLTDLAADSEKMVRHAAALARWYGSELLLVHASAPDLYVPMPSEPLSSWPESGLPLKEDAEEKLNRLIQVLGLQDLAPRLLIRHATIAAMLQDLTQFRPDLLILSTHGREGIRKWLLGSVAEEVFRKVEWPVLIVGPQCRDGEACAPKQFERILYGTDVSRVSVAALQYAARIADDHESTLIILYVEPDPAPEFSFGRALAGQKLKDWLQDHSCGLNQVLLGADLTVEFGKAEEKIIQVSSQRAADIIILGAHSFGKVSGAGSHLFGGTAYEVICSSTCPVLLVPPPH